VLLEGALVTLFGWARVFHSFIKPIYFRFEVKREMLDKKRFSVDRPKLTSCNLHFYSTTKTSPLF